MVQRYLPRSELALLSSTAPLSKVPRGACGPETGNVPDKWKFSYRRPAFPFWGPEAPQMNVTLPSKVLCSLQAVKNRKKGHGQQDNSPDNCKNMFNLMLLWARCLFLDATRQNIYHNYSELSQHAMMSGRARVSLWSGLSFSRWI